MREHRQLLVGLGAQDLAGLGGGYMLSLRLDRRKKKVACACVAEGPTKDGAEVSSVGTDPEKTIPAGHGTPCCDGGLGMVESP